jgi:hypothetical protein
VEAERGVACARHRDAEAVRGVASTWARCKHMLSMACGSHGAPRTMLRQCRRAGWSALTTRLRWSRTCRRVLCGRSVP